MRRGLGSLLLVILVSALASFDALSARAQEPAGTSRPKIGVALSGGGARGLAHVGVLEVLEELRVPVDLIAGTSMGAIVGGLYASGLPPDSLRAVVDDLDWERILADTPPRASLDFHRRADQRRYGVELEIGLSRSGLRLPTGLISGQDLGLLLRRRTLPAAPVEDFSRLPIPYAAVATDIATGERVVLDHGDLVTAMRASMAIPVVFSPVEIDGRLLVDGGLVDNLPVELARSMGADVVIAVDVSPPLLELAELRSLLGISEQLVNLMSRQALERQAGLADYVLDLELEGVGIFDFRDADSIIARGAAGARSRAADLTRWSIPAAEYAAYAEARATRRSPVVKDVDSLRIVAPDWVEDRLFLARIDPALIDSLDPDLAEQAVRHIHALGEFERVGYDVASRATGSELVLEAVGKPRGPHLVRFGIDLVTDSAGELPAGITFDATAGYARTRIGARAAEWRADVRAGTTTGIETWFRQPVDFAGRWFVEPSLQAVEFQAPVYAAESDVTEYESRRLLAGIDVGRSIGLSAEARAGLVYGRETAELDPRIDPLSDRFPRVGESAAEIRSSVVVDRLDAVNLPRRGIFARADLRASREELGAEATWARFSVEGRGYWSRGPHTVFVSLAGGAASPASALPAREEFRLGGFGSLSGFGEGELRGEAYARARAGWLRRIAETPPALRAVVAGAWIEAGDAWDPSRDEALDARIAATAGLGSETLIGPVFLAWSRAEGGRGRVTLSIGRSP
ncbi:MAG TPA: patatin-like phospholipase family protein [Gemmatimonadota bacterium]